MLVLAAHPDDETLGAGALLREVGDVVVAHVTDGAPKNSADARRAGFDSAEAYAAARRAEAIRALALANVPESAVRSLGFGDQETVRELAAVARAVARLVVAEEPDAVVTHPYEGGHADHDSTAFAARHALHLVARGGGRAPRLFEMTSYHAHGHEMRTGVFLANGGDVRRFELDETRLRRKRAMLACYATQAEVLRAFEPLGDELFRIAPDYDFQRPPHEGPLFYERQDWGTRGEAWRSSAARAIRALA